MADPELEAIRARRMAELQRQRGVSNIFTLDCSSNVNGSQNIYH